MFEQVENLFEEDKEETGYKVKEFDKQSLELEDGVYFNISDWQYFCQKNRYSQSEIKGVVEHVNNAYLKTPLNPLYKDMKPTAPMIKGSLVHLAVLEPDKFFQKCTPEFILKNQVNEIGFQMGNIATKIFDNIGCFVGGLPELAVLFTWNNLKFRAKFDYIKGDITLDLKTTTPQTKLKIYNIFYEQGYYLQQFIYNKARIQISKLFKDGKVYGANQDQYDILKDISERPIAPFVFYVLNLKTYEVAPVQCNDNEIMKLAEWEIKKAIRVIAETNEKGFLLSQVLPFTDIFTEFIPDWLGVKEKLELMEVENEQ